MIRKLTLLDAAAYQALITRGLKDHPESFRISLEDVGEPMIPFAINERDSFTLGAFQCDGVLVGAVSFEREARLKLQHKGLLYRMYVCSEAAGAGIGRKLMREVIHRAKTVVGLEQINLTVLASNAKARSLYLSEGFQVFAVEEHGLKISGQYFNEEQMALHLL
jgi:cyclohexyl-isocyanide hydratase